MAAGFLAPLRRFDYHYPMNRAFSLVELSIVLVILGLLTGGILAGQSLIRAAELRSVSADVNRFTAAAQSFRDKYFSMPGDFTKATSFWGNASTGTTGGECATPLTDVGTGTQTCNGNGDGYIGDGGASCHERHRMWQHLANAGLIEGSYSGIAGSAGMCHAVLNTTPTNSPRSRIATAGFSVASGAGTNAGHHSYFDGVYGQRFFFGAQNDTLASSLWAPVIKGEEAWNIDTKMDDGKPATGAVQTYKNGSTWGSPACATTNANATAEYALNVSGNICALMFKFN